MDTTQLRTQLERLWTTRPTRPASPRRIAGVCTGIGERYRVDPTLVKVAFVVAAVFGGSGVLLYLAAWIAFPSTPHARTDAIGGASHGWHNNPTVILWVVVVIVVSSVFSRGPWGSGGIVGGILMLIGWWLLFLRTPEPTDTSVSTVSAPEPPQRFVRWAPRAVRTGVTTTATTASASVPGAPGAVDLAKPTGRVTASPTSTTAPTPAAPTDVIEATPPSWDPLGAARFAWDLPEPTAPAGPPRPPAAHRRSALSFIVVGIAVLVVAGGIAAHGLGADWFTLPHVLSLALAVIGAGVLVNGLRRQSTHSHPGALIPLATGLCAAVIVTTLLAGVASGDHRLGMPSGGVGKRYWKPMSESAIRDEYTLTMGSMTLDLRAVDLTTEKTVHLRDGVGEIVVEVPAGMNVRAECTAGVGDYSCPEGLDGGSDGTSGPVLTIDAHTNVGSVKVQR
ncbi:PspC domain-containing protein [Gordonia oryzae]|uniref:PspC domain-containing protein n=1 Tax=Gordonia oryzae TaxID=2487349 RepID=A0A3N4GQL3_9ACTN|nr:PspC domain-containing protein [Gordonia oryzae]RPA65223.1 PspC domain-containing protein [Gordonia oryzae]